MTTFACCVDPDCYAPASVTPLGARPSTDGPVWHVRVACVAADRHLYIVPDNYLRSTHA